ncbi:MAG: hypothetical protein HC881_00960 [Leptolyngbyaceae cyanobacterium SL_7_1]|nr:hypothetical protein [Leptolyngbyaceae cyanobacterium SL_7_1]
MGSLFNKPLRSLIWFMAGLLCAMVMAIAPSTPVAAQHSISTDAAHGMVTTSVDGFQRVVASHLEPNFYN